jgi:hypothetical protein
VPGKNAAGRYRNQFSTVSEGIRENSRNGIGDERVAQRQRSTGSGGGSSISGNFPFIGFNERRNSASEGFASDGLAGDERLRGLGSMMSFFSCFLMTASLPGNSNSRGIRTRLVAPVAEQPDVSFHAHGIGRPG